VFAFFKFVNLDM